MRILSPFLALALSASTAFAADVAPLSPGAPAGVKPAQEITAGNHTWLYVAIGAAVIAGIAIAASGGDDNAASPAVAPVTTS
jgi:hypothetical protein